MTSKSSRADKARTASVLDDFKNGQSHKLNGIEILNINEVCAEKMPVKILRVLYHTIKALIKNVFFLNFASELITRF